MMRHKVVHAVNTPNVSSIQIQVDRKEVDVVLLALCSYMNELTMYPCCCFAAMLHTELSNPMKQNYELL